MLPAKSVYAARIEIKFLKSIKIYGKVGHFFLLSVACGTFFHAHAALE